MPQQGLVTSGVVVERNFAILPPEGIPESTLPAWRDTGARILAAPAMGADFAMYLLDVKAGGGTQHALESDVECFFYCIEGEATLTLAAGAQPVRAGGYAYLAPGSAVTLASRSGTRLIWLKKVYEPLSGVAPRDVIGNESAIPGEPFMEVAELLLKKLLPDEAGFDMAMNIFTFPPGYSLPTTETHVMEHGLFFLQGAGDYYLGDAWREVQTGDFIWMGPYCPQGFLATGSQPARYIYYKNVNRDVEL